MDRFEQAIALIDAANAEDPNRELVDGAEAPKELVYGRRMSAWMERLRPDAPEALRLGVRAQHVRRWEIPRTQYPMDRTGYLMWRKGLYKFHADTAAALLREAGYDEETIERVSFLIQKKQLTRDPDTQSLEDAACLVFLQFYIEAFAGDKDEEKLLGIVRKTWGKMSNQARGYALTLPFSPAVHGLLLKALAEPGVADA